MPNLNQGSSQVSTDPSSSTAFLLVFHGSHDPRPTQAAQRLAQFVRSQLSLLQSLPVGCHDQGAAACLASLIALDRDALIRGYSPSLGLPFSSLAAPLPLVGTACLETGVFSLQRQILAFGERVQAMGVTTLRIVPLFLLGGNHVLRDLPAEVSQAQRQSPRLTLDLTPHIGSHPAIKALVHSKFQAVSPEFPLLLAHGSRQRRSNQPVETLAEEIGGATAYWSIAPDLETRIIQLIQAGVQELAVLPYFLFNGTITDAITRHAEALAERFPKLRIHLLPALGPCPQLARIVVDLALNQVPPAPKPVVRPLQRIAFSQAM